MGAGKDYRKGLVYSKQSLGFVIVEEGQRNVVGAAKHLCQSVIVRHHPVFVALGLNQSADFHLQTPHVGLCLLGFTSIFSILLVSLLAGSLRGLGLLLLVLVCQHDSLFQRP